MSDRPSALLLVGTHRRAHRADPEDVAFGIYAFARDSASGALVPRGLTETPNPGWIAAHPAGRAVYAVNEVRDPAQAGISAFALDPDTAELAPIGRASLPAMPCHCEVDASGRFLLAATFGGGSVHLFALEADGRVGPELDAHHHHGSSAHPQRQTHPHAHAVVLDPSNRFVLVPDLGTDRLHVYALDANRGKMLAAASAILPPLSGPRHVAFGRDGRTAYLINEMSAQIAVFAFDACTGDLRLLASVDLLPEGFSGLRSGAAVLVHPDGRTLYATTRSHGSSGMPAAPGLDLLVWFGIDPDSGLLTLGGRLASGARIPRSIVFEPGGGALLVAHQCSGALVRFPLDPSSGAPGNPEAVASVPAAVCLAYVERTTG